MKLKIYWCDNHDGHCPIRVASVVVAKDRTQGKKLLDRQLRLHGLKPWNKEKYTLVELDIDCPHAIVISDGDDGNY